MRQKTDEISDCQKLGLLVRKNFYFHWRHKKQLFFILFSPVIFTLILLIARIHINVDVMPISQYRELNLTLSWQNLLETIEQRRHDLTENVFLFKPNFLAPVFTIAWAPDTREAFTNIMAGVSESLEGITFESYSTCQALRNAFQQHSYLAGVCFDEMAFSAIESDDLWIIDDVYPSLLNFTIIFPSELRRFEDSYIGASWHTYHMFDSLKNVETRMAARFDGGYVGYIREGFMSIQQAVSESYLKLIKDDTMDDFPPVLLQRFSYREHLFDELLENLYMPIELVTLFSYFYSVCLMTTQIVYEKENGSRVLLRTLGCHTWIYNTSWLISEVTILLLNNAVLLTLLKMYTNNGFSLLTRSSFLALFLFLFVYNLATVNFCILLASFMSKSRNSAFVTPLIWMSTFLLNLIILNEPELSVLTDVFVCIFTNCTMSMVWDIVLFFEMYGDGFRFSSFIDSITVDETIPVSLCCVIFVIQSIVYFCIAIFTDNWNPGSFMAKRRFHRATSTANEWRRLTQTIKSAVNAAKAFRSSLAPNTKQKKPDIKMKEQLAAVTNLSKMYGKQWVLENVTFSLFTNEITVLLGHNGAGKTTLMNTMAGLLQPNSGNVMVQRFNVHNEQQAVVTRIGIAMQENILFAELTVAEQIFFFGRLKGLSVKEAHAAVDKYCKALELHKYRYSLTGQLLTGILHMLSICCALAGKNRLVIIDELGHGLDMYRRSLLWDLLLFEKQQNRALFISTNSFESLDVLADRIIIMSNGKIKCNGSADFLRSTYRYGYHLICMKNENCMSKYVTEFIQNFIPNITPVCEIGKKITYIIAPHYENRIVPLMLELEEHLNDIYLESFSIDGKTAEDVYLGMMAEEYEDDGSMGLHQILNGQCRFHEENKNPKFLMKYNRLKFCKLWLSQFCALMLKRLIQMKRNLVILSFRIFLPLLLCIIPFFLATTDLSNTTQGILNFTLSEYQKTLTVISTLPITSSLKDLPMQYVQTIMALENPNHAFISLPAVKFEGYVLTQQRERFRFANKKIIVGAAMGDEKLICFFNNYPLHSVPLAMNMMYNAIAKTYVDNAGIVVNFHPMPFILKYRLPQKYMPMSLNYFLTMAVPLSLIISWSSSLVIMICENNTRFKMLQFIAGARINTYWLVTFIVDFAILLVTAAMAVIVFRIFCNPNMCDRHTLEWYWWGIILQGISIISFNYMILHLFNSPTYGFIFIMLIHSYSIGLYFIIFEVFSLDDYGFNEPFHINKWLAVMPAYNFAYMMWRIYAVGELNLICSQEVVEMISVYHGKCERVPNCCIKPNMMSSNTGIYLNLILCIVLTIVSWTVHILIEVMLIWRPKQLVRRTPLDNIEAALIAHERVHSDEESALNIDDVIAEKVRTLTIKPRELKNKALLCQYLGKKFHNKTAIERLNFIVEHFQCFGILGSNSAGKTILLQLLAAEANYSYGRVYIDGVVMHKHRQRTLDIISYSPQNAAVMNDFTPSEIMDIYARLCGIPANVKSEICKSLVKALGFYTYYNKLLRNCSNGINRRLSSAIAMLGHPSIIFLDDPGSGVDPVGKRQFYNIISKIRLTGTAIVLTTYSSRECEGFCNRLAILMDGKFFSVGSTMDLQDKFGVGYMLQLRMDKLAKGEVIESTRPEQASRKYLKVITFIESMFPGAVLKARRSNILYFFLLLKPNTIAGIYEVVSPHVAAYNILEFSISRCTLGTIYLELIEKHKFLETKFKSQNEFV